MTAAVGQRYYYQDGDDYKKIAGGLREKYGVNNLFDAYYKRTMTSWEQIKTPVGLTGVKHLRMLYLEFRSGCDNSLCQIIEGIY